MKPFWGKLRNGSMFFKISVLVTMIVLTAVFMTFVITTNYFSAEVMRMGIASGKVACEQMQRFALEKYDRSYGLFTYIHSTNNLSGLFSEIVAQREDPFSAKATDAVNTFLSATLSADPDLSDVVLLTTNGYTYSRSADQWQSIKTSYDFLGNDKLADFWVRDSALNAAVLDDSMHRVSTERQYVTFAIKIYNTYQLTSKQPIGLCLLIYPMDVFDAVVRDLQSGGNTLMILDGESNILYSSNPARINTSFEASSVDTKDMNLVRLPVGISGLSVLGLTSLNILMGERNRIVKQLLLITALITLCSVLILAIVFSIFNRRMKMLERYINSFERGNFNAEIPVDSHDEVGKLARAFNKMSAELNIYINKTFAAELSRKAAELDTLHAQINPHFLYNTLEKIRAKALEDNAVAAAEMIASLGNLFRWSIKDVERIVGIEEELEYVQAYLELQQYCNENILFSIQISEELYGMGIPKLTLQPLIENSVMHGFAQLKTSGSIHITGTLEKKSVCFTIRDDGEGMTADALRTVREKFVQAQTQAVSKSIGLINVYRRMKLLFGQKFILEINSEPLKGTCVTLSFPAMTQKEMLTFCTT